jgi:hypothetical protein
MHWRYKKLIKIDFGNLQGRAKLGDQVINGKIILINIFKFYMLYLNLMLLCCWQLDINWPLMRYSCIL